MLPNRVFDPDEASDRFAYRFFLVAPTIQQLRIAIWMRKWIREWGMDVQFQDVTSLYTTLGGIGTPHR